MKKNLISILIGLLSATGIFTGIINQSNQNSINAVKIEENAATEDANTEDLETDDHISDDASKETSIESIENIEETIADKFEEEITEETIVDLDIDDTDKINNETIENVEEKETEAKVIAPSTEKKQEPEKASKEKEVKQYGINLNEVDNTGKNKGNDDKKEVPKYESKPDNTTPKETEVSKEPQPSKTEWKQFRHRS